MKATTKTTKAKKIYNHAFEVAFEVKSAYKNPRRIPINVIRAAMAARASQVTRDAVTCYDQDTTGK